MFKLIPLVLSLTLIGAGGAAISVQNSNDMAAKITLQNYMYTNNNAYLNIPNGSNLFLKANTNPGL